MIIIDNEFVKDNCQRASIAKSMGKFLKQMMMYIIIGAAFVLVAGVGIYAKIIKPKKQGSAFDDEEEAEGYGEDYSDGEHYGSPEYLPEDDTDGDE